MSTDIIAAIVGGAFSMLVAYITWLLGRRPPELDGYINASSDRVEAIKGRWQGTLLQPDYPGGGIDSKVEMNFDIQRRIVIGTGRIATEFDSARHGRSGPASVNLNIRGVFFNDQFLKIDYRNASPSVLQFGAMILVLDPTAESLDGHFIGYGSHAKAIVTGRVALKRTT
jgi:hypothetical protein